MEYISEKEKALKEYLPALTKNRILMIFGQKLLPYPGNIP